MTSISRVLILTCFDCIAHIFIISIIYKIWSKLFPIAGMLEADQPVTSPAMVIAIAKL